MRYKVLYHQGESIGLQTRTMFGELSVDRECLEIRGSTELLIPVRSIHSVERFRLHGTGRMLKVCHKEGTIFLSVIRFNLFGYFAITNFLATGKLQREIEDLIQS